MWVNYDDIETDLKTTVLRQLKRGKAHAVKGKVLATRIGERNTRQMRQAIRELIADGVPIIGSVTEPYGYYIAETPQECETYLAELKSYLVEHAYRRRDFKVASRAILQPGQMRLGLLERT